MLEDEGETTKVNRKEMTEDKDEPNRVIGNFTVKNITYSTLSLRTPETVFDWYPESGENKKAD